MKPLTRQSLWVCVFCVCPPSVAVVWNQLAVWVMWLPITNGQTLEQQTHSVWKHTDGARYCGCTNQRGWSIPPKSLLISQSSLSFIACWLLALTSFYTFIVLRLNIRVLETQPSSASQRGLDFNQTLEPSKVTVIFPAHKRNQVYLHQKPFSHKLKSVLKLISADGFLAASFHCTAGNIHLKKNFWWNNKCANHEGPAPGELWSLVPYFLGSLSR